jgi:flavin-dependent dehydrogenase
MDVDVAIVGGGPAGSAAALALLRQSDRRVVVIERTSYDDWRAGEALSPAVRPLLQYLDAEQLLDAHAHLEAHGTTAAWGSDDLIARDFMYTGQGPGWHLNRLRFDRELAGLVRRRGGAVLEGCTIAAAQRSAESWHLTIRGARESTINATAQFVIDATGRRAAFGRQRTARRRVTDRLFALVGFCAFRRGTQPDTFTVVEATEHGWWYSSLLPADRMVVAFMTDADIIRQRRLQTMAAWLTLVRATSHTYRRMEGGSVEQPPIICPAFSQVLQPIAGDRWIAAGDAALGFDPISAMGIGYAIASGIHAARAIHEALAGHGPQIAAYPHVIKQHYDRYLVRRSEYYAMETRWPGAAFWERRRAPAAPDVRPSPDVRQSPPF